MNGDQIATLRAQARDAESRGLMSKDGMAKAGWEAIARRCRNLLAEAEPLSGPDRGRASKPRS